MKCIFEDSKTLKENETFAKQLKELVSYFCKLQSIEARNKILKLIKEIEEMENGVRN
jgi:hypothetical protein